MSLFTSTEAPLVGSMKRDPTYSCKRISVAAGAGTTSSAFPLFLEAYGLQLAAAF